MQTLQTLIHGAGIFWAILRASHEAVHTIRQPSRWKHIRPYQGLCHLIMYRIEVLPSTSAHVTPGWTYVPDRGLDPAQAAITPTIGRKRGIRDGGRTDLSSRQSNAIIRHLAELDRENHRDVHIPIPVKQKDAARGTASITLRFYLKQPGHG